MATLNPSSSAERKCKSPREAKTTTNQILEKQGCTHFGNFVSKDFYLFERERETKSMSRGTSRGTSRLLAEWEAPSGARSQYPEIMTRAEVRRPTG